jgi:hypothetical protein
MVGNASQTVQWQHHRWPWCCRRWSSMLFLQDFPKWSPPAVELCSMPLSTKKREIENPLSRAGAFAIFSVLKAAMLRHSKLQDVVTASVLLSVMHQQAKSCGITLFETQFVLPGMATNGEGSKDANGKGPHCLFCWSCFQFLVLTAWRYSPLDTVLAALTFLCMIVDVPQALLDPAKSCVLHATTLSSSLRPPAVPVCGGDT